MGKFSMNQWIGIALILAALLLFAPIPFINGRTIGAVIIIAIGIWQFFR